MTSTQLVVPDSVRAYFSDRTVEAGVDAMLSVSPNKLAPGLTWDELPSYYRARAAAETVRCDFVALMYDAWSRVWGDVIAGLWVRNDIEDAIVSPRDCFAEQFVRVDFEVAGRQLLTSVGLRGGGLVCAFSLEKGRTAFVKGGLDGFEWVNDETWSGWMVSSTGLPMLGALDLEELQRLTAGALKLVHEMAK